MWRFYLVATLLVFVSLLALVTSSLFALGSALCENARDWYQDLRYNLHVNYVYAKARQAGKDDAEAYAEAREEAGRTTRWL